MNIEDKVAEALKDEEERVKQEDFLSLRDFYIAMKQKGLVIQQDYTLPPLDTVGQHRYRNVDEKER